MMSHIAWLVIRGVGPEQWCHPIRSGAQVLGRSADCDIQVPHRSVSRRHAEIRLEHESCFIRDLGSLNGTYVNDVRIAESRLAIGMHLRLAQVVMDVVADPHEGDPTAIVEFDDEPLAVAHAGTAATLELSRTAAAVLTPGQRQVLKLLLRGLSEKEAAGVLSLSRQTIHTHVKDIYRQLGVHSRAELLSLFISPTVESHFQTEG